MDKNLNENKPRNYHGENEFKSSESEILNKLYTEFRNTEYLKLKIIVELRLQNESYKMFKAWDLNT